MNISKLLFALLIGTGFFTSCDKSYKYVETYNDVGIVGGSEIKEKEGEILKAKDDSTAYLKAFMMFCYSVKISNDMKQAMGKVYSIPLSFKLYNDKNVDITNTTLFATRSKREKEIEEQISSRENYLQKAVDESKKEENDNFKRTTKIDSLKVKELEKYFRKRKDEFSNKTTVWYEPKNAPKFTNSNGLYCYFQTENGIPNNLRFRMQYYSDDWLFFNKVQFSIDGKAFDFVPLFTERDSGDGGFIWEWFDVQVSESDKELINALANANTAKMKLIGSQYYDVKIVTREQIKSIKRTLEIYVALGGK